MLLALGVIGSMGKPISSPSVSGIAVSGPTAAAKVENWTYSETKDPMRGSTIYRATADSTDRLNLPQPYGPDIQAHIEIRRRPSDGLNVIFAVDKGQILCSAYSGHRLNFKFDSGSVKSFTCENSSDGTDDVAFVGSPATILSRLKASKHVTIEAEFFDSGSHQLRFDVSGLNWKH